MSINLSLDRVRRLAAHLDPYTRPTIHVAGTNGKGSVTAIISSILHASGLSVGRFNSPHLVSIYDSILVNGEPVSPDVYHRAREQVSAADQDLETRATPFELLTLTGLQILESAKLDIVVLEVGMGGRDDATNIIPDNCILVSVLTSVDLDHQTFLGDTIELIAEHKAGIARPGKPLVLGAQKHAIVEPTVRRVVEAPETHGCLILSTPVHPQPSSVEYHFSPSERPFVPPPGQAIQFHSTAFRSPIHAKLPLHGAHQLDNLALSLSVVSTLITQSSDRTALGNLSDRITTKAVCSGIERVSWPGRLTLHPLPPAVTARGLHSSTVLVDGAHNTASAETLASYLSELVARLRPRSKLHITYIIALSHSPPPKTPLSHSPPKTPYNTLFPIMSRCRAENSVTKVRVAALRFTPPEGMPWVTCVSPLEIRDTVQKVMQVMQVIPLGDEDMWTAPEDVPVNRQLQSAFEWAEAGHAACAEDEKLVVLSGSLYLVADFYRLLNRLEG